MKEDFINQYVSSILIDRVSKILYTKVLHIADLSDREINIMKHMVTTSQKLGIMNRIVLKLAFNMGLPNVYIKRYIQSKSNKHTFKAESNALMMAIIQTMEYRNSRMYKYEALINRFEP